MSTGARSSLNTSTKGEGTFIQEQKTSGFAVAQKLEEENTMFALRSKQYSTPSATTEKNADREQLPISCEAARNSELLSLASTTDVIYLVYSRIPCLFDELVCDEDSGNGSAIHLADHEQSRETCWQRGSYLSLTSEASKRPAVKLHSLPFYQEGFLGCFKEGFNNTWRSGVTKIHSQTGSINTFSGQRIAHQRESIQ
ncbi:unnamed protein product [Calicophoron daubneyi]|uniref:Uncharacterized protein n=1 Tax=Calicophoron daubneyi TaxID=300641 RepID=A0AAV2SWH0_CALDB